MASTIAAFPLGIVCFPGEVQNLHIFEERYKELITDCIDHNITFAIVPFRNSKAFHLGTEMSLLQVAKKYPDGKYDVSLKAERLIKVHRLTKKFPGKSYPAVKMSPLSWDEISDYSLAEQIVNWIKRLYTAISIVDKIPAPSEFLIRMVVHKIGLSVEQELQLLAIDQEKDRQRFVLNHLQDFVPTIERANELRLKAVLNGHFKNVNPAEF